MPHTIFQKKYRLFTLFAFALYIFFPACALAQAYTGSKTNDQEAQRLKASFQELLDYQKVANEAFGNIEVTYKGELTIERQQDYYTLTFPHIYLSGSVDESAADDVLSAKQVVDIGVFTLNAMADEKPGYWKIVLTLPEKITVYDALKGRDDPEAFSFTIGQQRTIAYFSEKLCSFTKMDLNLSDLNFLAGGTQTGINIGGIQVYTKLEEQENGSYSGPGHVLVKNLHVSPPNQAAAVTMDELKLSFSFGDFAIPSLKETQKKIMKHKETLQKLQALDGQTDESAPQVDPQNVINMIYDFYDFDMDSFSFAYSAKNINITMPPPIMEKENSAPDFKTMQIASGRFGTGATGLKTDEGALRIEWAYDGFKTTQENPEITDIVPQNLKINLEAQNVPYNTFGELANNTLQSIAQNPDAMQTAWLSIMMRLPAIISQAGTQIMINDNNINNHLYDITLDGKITTDLSAITGFALKLNLLFEGMETLINAMQNHSIKQENSETNEYKEFIATLEKIKNVGHAATGKNNNPAYSYTIELNQQGEPTINGVRATTVFFVEE